MVLPQSQVAKRKVGGGGNFCRFIPQVLTSLHIPVFLNVQIVQTVGLFCMLSQVYSWDQWEACTVGTYTAMLELDPTVDF